MIKNVFVEGDNNLSGLDIHRKIDEMMGISSYNRNYHVVRIKFYRKGAFVIISQN